MIGWHCSSAREVDGYGRDKIYCRIASLPLRLSLQVDWNRVGNDAMTWFQSLSAQVSSPHVLGALGIPATSGLAIGLVIGLAKS
jgi:hypothetical protein